MLYLAVYAAPCRPPRGPRFHLLGEAVRAGGEPFKMALTAAVVRHADRSVYRVYLSVRDISRRPSPD